jgi:hypothetical protein
MSDVGLDLGGVRRIGIRPLTARFGFGAVISIVAGIVGLAAGDRAGGVLLAFPAILPAALTLIESTEGTSAAVSDVRGAVTGALGMICFALTVVVLAGRIPTVLALVVATATWATVSVARYVGGITLARRRRHLHRTLSREAPSRYPAAPTSGAPPTSSN